MADRIENVAASFSEGRRELIRFVTCSDALRLQPSRLVIEQCIGVFLIKFPCFTPSDRCTKS